MRLSELFPITFSIESVRTCYGINAYINPEEVLKGIILRKIRKAFISMIREKKGAKNEFCNAIWEFHTQNYALQNKPDTTVTSELASQIAALFFSDNGFEASKVTSLLRQYIHHSECTTIDHCISGHYWIQDLLNTYVENSFPLGCLLSSDFIFSCLKEIKNTPNAILDDSKPMKLELKNSRLCPEAYIKLWAANKQFITCFLDNRYPKENIFKLHALLYCGKYEESFYPLVILSTKLYEQDKTMEEKLKTYEQLNQAITEAFSALTTFEPSEKTLKLKSALLNVRNALSSLYFHAGLDVSKSEDEARAAEMTLFEELETHASKMLFDLSGPRQEASALSLCAKLRAKWSEIPHDILSRKHSSVLNDLQTVVKKTANAELYYQLGLFMENLILHDINGYTLFDAYMEAARLQHPDACRKVAHFIINGYYEPFVVSLPWAIEYLEYVKNTLLPLLKQSNLEEDQERAEHLNQTVDCLTYKISNTRRPIDYKKSLKIHEHRFLRSMPEQTMKHTSQPFDLSTEVFKLTEQTHALIK